MQQNFLAMGNRIANALENLAVVGFGLGVYEGRMVAVLTGLVSLTASLLITWRITR